MAKVLKITSRSEMDWDEVLVDYLMFKNAQGLRDITVKGHRDVRTDTIEPNSRRTAEPAATTRQPSSSPQ